MVWPTRPRLLLSRRITTEQKSFANGNIAETSERPLATQHAVYSQPCLKTYTYTRLDQAQVRNCVRWFFTVDDPLQLSLPCRTACLGTMNSNYETVYYRKSGAPNSSIVIRLDSSYGSCADDRTLRFFRCKGVEPKHCTLFTV